MKKRMFTFLLAGMLAATTLLSGCTGAAAKKAQEYKELGISQMEAGEYDSAVASFQKALDQSVGSIGAEEMDVCYYKALALYKSGDAQGAIDTYTALIDYDKDNWEVYYLRGNVYLQEQRQEEALADYEKAVSLRSEDAELCVHIYEDLCDAGLSDKGQAYYDKVMNITPSEGEEFYYIGDMYFLTGDYENARTNLLAAQEKGYDRALLMLGQIYAAEGSDDDAKAAFSSYMEKYPDDAKALNELGEIALSAKEYEDAVIYLESALDAADSSMEAAIEKNLIAAYEYSGDFKSAYNMAKSYLKSYSDDEVERELEFLKTRMGSVRESGEQDSDADNSQAQGDVSGEEADAASQTDEEES